MNHRVESFNAAIEHFWELGEGRYLGHGQAIVRKELGSAASRNEFDPQSMQRLGKRNNALFVGYR